MAKYNDTFFIAKTIKGRYPTLPFLKIKEAVLGKKYKLNLIFIGSKRSQKLNKKYRGKNKPTNILSFSYLSDEGEIFITPDIVKKEAPKYQISYTNLCAFLFISTRYILGWALII